MTIDAIKMALYNLKEVAVEGPDNSATNIIAQHYVRCVCINRSEPRYFIGGSGDRSFSFDDTVSMLSAENKKIDC